MSRKAQTLREGDGLAFPSGHLLLAAKESAELSMEHPMQALSAILLSVASVEGWFHDTAEMCAQLWEIRESPGAVHRDLPAGVGRFAELRVLGSFDRATVKERILLICIALAIDPPDLGRAPFNDLDQLIVIRNHLAHSRPEVTVPLEDAKGKVQGIGRSLAQRGLIRRSALRARGAMIGWLETPETARWAHATARDARRALLNLMPAGSYLIPIATVDMTEEERDRFYRPQPDAQPAPADPPDPSRPTPVADQGRGGQ